MFQGWVGLESAPHERDDLAHRGSERRLVLVLADDAFSTLASVIDFLTALVGSAIQVFIRWRRRKPLPQAA
jgi:hypothetical protein